jgi:hypothetical protein
MNPPIIRLAPSGMSPTASSTVVVLIAGLRDDGAFEAFGRVPARA